MTKTVALLWNGGIDPIRHSGTNNAEKKQLEDLMQRNLEKLEGSLDEKAKEILKNYNDCMSEYMQITLEQAFCHGFCLGTKLTAEALLGAEQV